MAKPTLEAMGEEKPFPRPRLQAWAFWHALELECHRERCELFINASDCCQVFQGSAARNSSGRQSSGPTELSKRTYCTEECVDGFGIRFSVTPFRGRAVRQAERVAEPTQSRPGARGVDEKPVVSRQVPITSPARPRTGARRGQVLIAPLL